MNLGHEAGEPFNAYFDPQGLPEKLVYFPSFKGDSPAEPRVLMRLVAYEGGDKLAAYLRDIGLQSGAHKMKPEPGVDFSRHGAGFRGGLLYFDIYSEQAVHKLLERANALGAAPVTPWTERVNQAPPSERER